MRIMLGIMASFLVGVAFGIVGEHTWQQQLPQNFSITAYSTVDNPITLRPSSSIDPEIMAKLAKQAGDNSLPIPEIREPPCYTWIEQQATFCINIDTLPPMEMHYTHLH